MTDTVFFTTDSVEPGSKNDAWREIIAPLFTTELSPDATGEDFDGFIESKILDTILLVAAAFNAQNFVRDHRLVLDSEMDCYYVVLLLSGVGVGRVGRTEITCKRGDIMIIDLTRPIEIDASGATIISVLLPRGRLEHFTRGRTIHGLVLNSNPSLNRIFSDTLLSIFANSSNLDRGDTIHLEDMLMNMIGSFATREIRHLQQSDSDPLLLLRYRILEFIDENAFNPDLTPKLILDRFKISRAHLYRVFAEDGGVSKIIKEKRLDFAYRSLAQTAERRTIKGLAHNLGFTSTKQFQRAFQDRFGITPREASQRVLNNIYDFLPTRRLFNYIAKRSTKHKNTSHDRSIFDIDK